MAGAHGGPAATGGRGGRRARAVLVKGVSADRLDHAIRTRTDDDLGVARGPSAREHAREVVDAAHAAGLAERNLARRTKDARRGDKEAGKVAEYLQIDLPGLKWGAVEHRGGRATLFAYNRSGVKVMVRGDRLRVEKDGITG